MVAVRDRVGVTTRGLHEMWREVGAIGLHVYPAMRKPCGELSDLVHARAGEGLRREMTEMDVSLHDMKKGDVRVTGGHRLPADWVIHCVTPGWMSKDCEEKLAACYRNAFKAAADKRVDIMAIRRLATSFPADVGAKIAFQEASAHLQENEWPRRIVFSLWEVTTDRPVFLEERKRW